MSADAGGQRPLLGHNLPMSLLKRSLMVIWIPPLFGIVLTGPLFWVMATFGDRYMAWLMVLGSCFAVSLPSSLIWWALMELIWRWSGPERQTRSSSIVIGGLSGAILAALTKYLLHSPHTSARQFSEFGLVGLVCGVILGWVVFPVSRLGRNRVLADPAAAEPGLGGFRSAMVILAAVFGSGLVLATGSLVGRFADFHLPSDSSARRQFARHRETYNRLVDLIQKDPGMEMISRNGEVNPVVGKMGRVVPEYRELMAEIGAQQIMVREDGAIEFEIWGSGGAIMSDSFKGIRYWDEAANRGKRAGWTAKLVPGLADDQLPKERGQVATGLYVVPIEGNWFIYRFEYQE